MSVVSKIKSRIAELMAGGQTRADAMRLAAKEFHQELAAPLARPDAMLDAEDAAVSRLDLAVAGIRARLWPDAKPDEDLSEKLFAKSPSGLQTPRPTPEISSPGFPTALGGPLLGRIGGLIPRYRLKEDQEPAPPELSQKEKDRRAMLSQIYTGRSGPELIPDDEFLQGLIDPTTANWRQSVEAASRPRVSGVDEIPAETVVNPDALAAYRHLRVIK